MEKGNAIGERIGCENLCKTETNLGKNSKFHADFLVSVAVDSLLRTKKEVSMLIDVLFPCRNGLHSDQRKQSTRYNKQWNARTDAGGKLHEL